MNYLDRIKQIDGQKIFTPAPENELTKPPKAPSGSSVSTSQGVFEEIQTDNALADRTANDDGVIRSIWLMHFIDRNPLTATFSPAVTHAGALACYPDAVAAEPIEPMPEAAEPPVTTLDHSDERRTCKQCANLCGGVCTIARPGGVVSAIKNYRPGEMFKEQLHRCEGFTERTATAEGLAQFIRDSLEPICYRMVQEAEFTPAIKAQTLGEGLQAHRLEKLNRYETHLDRKFERTLAMLLKLKDLRGA